MAHSAVGDAAAGSSVGKLLSIVGQRSASGRGKKLISLSALVLIGSCLRFSFVQGNRENFVERYDTSSDSIVTRLSLSP